MPPQAAASCASSLSPAHTSLTLANMWRAPRPVGLRRKRRRQLVEQGFRAEINASTPAELPALLATFFEIEASGWKGGRGSSLLARPDLRRFFSELAETSVRDGALVISLLRGPEHSIAAQLCIDDGLRFFGLKTGYDERWGKYAPGVLLAADTIEFAVKIRERGYEFLGLAEDWQKPWATGTREYCAAVFTRKRPPASRSWLWMSR